MSSQEPDIREGIASTITQLSLDVNKLKTDVSQIRSGLKQIYALILAESNKPVLCIFCLKQQQWCRGGHYLCLDCDKEHIKINYACDFEVRNRECQVHNTKIAYKEDLDGYY